MIADILTVLKAASANIAAATAAASKPKASGQTGDIRRAAFIAGLRASKKITSPAGEAFYNQLYDLTGGVGPFYDPSGKSLDIPGLAPEDGGGATMPPPSVSGSPHMESVAEGGENAQEYTRILGGGGGSGGRRRRRRRIRKPPIIARPAAPREGTTLPESAVSDGGGGSSSSGLGALGDLAKLQKNLLSGKLGTALGVPLQAGLGLLDIGRAATRNLTDPNSTPFRAAGDIAHAGIGAAGGVGGAALGTYLGGPVGGIVGGVVGKMVAEPLGKAFGALIALPEKIEAFGAALLKSSGQLRQYDPGINMMLGDVQQQKITLARQQALVTSGYAQVQGRSQMFLREQMQPYKEMLSEAKSLTSTIFNWAAGTGLFALRPFAAPFLPAQPQGNFVSGTPWQRLLEEMSRGRTGPHVPHNLRPGEGPGGRLH